MVEYDSFYGFRGKSIQEIQGMNAAQLTDYQAELDKLIPQCRTFRDSCRGGRKPNAHYHASVDLNCMEADLAEVRRCLFAAAR